MVLPDRLMPGRMAKACASPMVKARHDCSGRFPLGAFWEKKRMPAVMQSMPPTNWGLARASMESLNPSPTTAAGTALNKIQPM